MNKKFIDKTGKCNVEERRKERGEKRFYKLSKGKSAVCKYGARYGSGIRAHGGCLGSRRRRRTW